MDEALIGAFPRRVRKGHQLDPGGKVSLPEHKDPDLGRMVVDQADLSPQFGGDRESRHFRASQGIRIKLDRLRQVSRHNAKVNHRFGENLGLFRGSLAPSRAAGARKRQANAKELQPASPNKKHCRHATESSAIGGSA
jgi:hypothetical protein